MTVQSLFDVTISHNCDNNPFTINDQLDYTYTVPAGTVDANSPVYTLAKTVVSGQNPICALSFRTQMWDTVTLSYITLSAAFVNTNLNSFI